MIRLETTVAYTVKEVAEKLGKTDTTVRNYIKSGKLRAQKVGRSFYITDRDLTVMLTGEKPETR